MTSSRHVQVILSALLTFLFQVTLAQETVYASFVLARTGERTPLVQQWIDITQLTALGANSIYNVGSDLRSRYINSNNTPSTTIAGLSPDVIDPVQLYLLARDDQYNSASAQAFMQAFYPPTTMNDTYDTDLGLLANGSIALNPLGGFQYPFIHGASVTDPKSVYTNGAANCRRWDDNSNAWLESPEFMSIQNATADLYKRAGDVLGDANLMQSEYGFENAYTIADYLAYMFNHNGTFHDLLTNGSYLNSEHYGQLLGLSNQYQWSMYGSGNGASNSTIGLVAGQSLASLISSSLTSHVDTLGQSYKLSLLVTEFPAFLSFSTLAQLPATPASDGVDFTAMPDFGSHLVLELFTKEGPTAAGSYPDGTSLRVRLLFRNGTDTSKPLAVFPMFGTNQPDLAWYDFKERLDSISLQGTMPTPSSTSILEAWCSNCEAWTDTFFCLFVNDVALAAVSESSVSNRPPGPITQSGGMTNVVAGAMGAVATLCLLVIIMFLGVGCLGWRVTRKPYGNHGVSEAVSSGAPAHRTSGGGFKGALKLSSDMDLPAGADAEPKHGRVSSWEMKNAAGGAKTESDTLPPTETWGRRREVYERSERLDPFMDPVQPRESV